MVHMIPFSSYTFSHRRIHSDASVLSQLSSDVPILFTGLFASICESSGSLVYSEKIVRLLKLCGEHEGNSSVAVLLGG